MKFVLSLVLVAYVATVVESTFLKEAMGAMRKLTKSDSYSEPSYSEPSYSAPSYSAPVYQEAQPVYVVEPESREYVTEVRKVKHVPVYPVKKYKTKHVYSKGYDSGESYSRESNEYGTYNSGSHMIYRREAPQPWPPATWNWNNGNNGNNGNPGNPGNNGNPGNPGNNGNPGNPGNNGNPGQNGPWRG